jgi:hypothetical protein
MSDTANVRSLDALKTFRAALIKFAEGTNTALSSSESDVQRTLTWLERDQTVFWDGQLRKRHDEVMRCEDAVRQKRLFKAPDGSQQSVVDEVKALGKARLRREEAEAKTVAVKKAIGVLRRESLLYKGRVQKLATTVQIEVPHAVHLLDQMLKYLEEYLSLQTAGGGGAAVGSPAEAFEQMMRMGLAGAPAATAESPAAAEAPAVGDSQAAADGLVGEPGSSAPTPPLQP